VHVSDKLPVVTGSSMTPTDLESVIDGVRSVVEMVREGPISRLRLDFGPLQVEVECAAGPLATSVAGQPPSSSPEVPRPGENRLLAHVDAPLVGVFYRAPGPGKPPFVETGQRVEAGQQVAIIEAMKMMNFVVAGRSGTVVDILAPDGEVVEFEQHLIAIEPDLTGRGPTCSTPS
jgi:acetyl-CoA carboxylase biotin carboxyl carrier protein